MRRDIRDASISGPNATDLPSDTDLDKSNAFAAAEDVIRSWVDTEDDSDLKAAHVRAVARACTPI